ncbi:MAG TPA: signal recognition particle-docking protein FtsY [Candidatus Dormibacteraeota bacterium]|nr:signal recognition particle-docking protein FtsY [Candidatus Dormibacteraeota bacterium]
MSWFSKLRDSLFKSRAALSRVEELARERRPLDAAFWEELEETLIAADFGVETTEKILESLQDVARKEFWRTSDQAIARFRTDVAAFMTRPGQRLQLAGKPAVVLVVGVNGSGKTTSIGKLAARLVREGKKVLLVAGDTFRAAAAEQLEIWGQRAGAEVIRGREGGDPAAVVFDGVSAARARGVDVCLVDTAGRLQTKVNLMEELKKIRRVIARELPDQPCETLLVLDAATGQNALSQASLFNETTQLTGLVLTKLDGTAKGGIVVAIADRVGVPVKFIGVGEGIDQLQAFEPQAFVDALFD